MNYEHMKTIGTIMRGLQTHRVNAAFSARQCVRVTYTHEVYKEHESHFESLVEFLVKNYQPVTPQRFFRMMKNEEPVDGRYFLMTLDDGLLSSYHAIKKILSKFNLKAIVFVPTQILELKTVADMKRFTWQQLGFHVGQEAPASLREETYLFMGARELVDLKKDGHAVFPHTHSHKRLHEVADEQTAVEELVKPRKILQDLLQEDMNAFAFPVGTERVVSGFSFPYLKREYQFCFSALAGKNTAQSDPHFLRRDCLNAYYDLDHVRNIEEGVFDLYYGYKQFRLRQAFHAH